MLVKNKYFRVFEENDHDVFIVVDKSGYDIKDFNEDVLKKNPRITITNFLKLKDTLEVETGIPINIGILKPKIQVVLSSDKMEAKIKFNVNEAEFESMKSNLQTEILSALEYENVTYGILYDILKQELQFQKEMVIAKGVAPINGEDAKIKYVDLLEKKPVIREDGKVDYYEMNLIHKVNTNDWIGEKISATEGEAGRTVTNQILPPKAGKDNLLRYDTKTVKESLENGKIVLRALVDGAVTFEEGKIKVLNHLIINGDVDFDTGNINFNGYVTIKGIVSDGFSVKADKDISIEGTMGIGAIERLTSKDGDIFIKGGISGKGKAIIEAGKNVFVKYANDCTIFAKENINIGLYAMDTHLHAKNILVNSEKGKIIGGSLNAEAKIKVYTIGNISERRTVVNVKGFDRQAFKKELDDLLVLYKKHLIDLEKNKRQMKIYEMKLKTDDKSVQGHEYSAYIQVNDTLLAKIAKLEERRKRLIDFLESKGEGEINILRKAYPQTFIEIKNIQKRISKITSGTYYAMDNKLHFL
ncbi:hypothetical protein SAMN05660297_02197 [Natronincola peptidivorans]|uniref:Flagellar Assembly Protein A N-terminal region domain-containing protein n=1 Tax=Natronincola peptidivorans TaxID=426128 RepID=A0A1I0DZ95_9FIRM|nr:FapA family protein [Natronincola peptidivorans]SET37362.1 hypothetical protein SAMN05660297_02197 [Natronincola peptidivorans]